MVVCAGQAGGRGTTGPECIMMLWHGKGRQCMSMPVACTVVSSRVVVVADPLSFIANGAALMPVVIPCLAHDALGTGVGSVECSAGPKQHHSLNRGYWQDRSGRHHHGTATV
eukprot:1157745-Pelagomonas_calceolata.AAC.1